MYEITATTPNPTQGAISIDFTAGANNTVFRYINDFLGKTIDKGQIDCSTGKNSLGLDLSTREQGTYFLILKANDESTIPMITKIVKQ